MKRFYGIVLLCALMLACNKTDYQNQCFDSSFGINQANKEFAIILSKALYNESELRQFIKDESLKKKDYDTDVFYPWVKDVEVCNGETFEQVLMKYDAENKLGDILAANPLLTMLLPDWSWVDPACFSPDKWDITRPEIGVGYLDGADTHPLICNGEVAFSMKDGEFLDVPVIIVKQNDRLRKTGGTKGCEPSYKFIYEDFTDVSSIVSTKGESRYTTINLPYEVVTDSLMLSEIDTQLVMAYNINLSNSYASQRDNIYYGMTATVDSGLVNRNVYETLVKFKINPSTVRVYDDTLGLGNDYTKKEYYYTKENGSIRSLTTSQLLAKTWGEGAAELRIKILYGSTPVYKVLSVPFSDAFSVKKVLKRENYNWLGALKSRAYYLNYDVNQINMNDWLSPKWIEVNYQLFNWDISQFPRTYFIEFTEVDEGAQYTTTETVGLTFMTNFKSVVEATIKILKIGFEAGASATENRSYSYSVQYNQGDDNLGSFGVQYGDKVLLGVSGQKARMKTYTTGAIDAMIIPVQE